jgi:hypothetical protein
MGMDNRRPTFLGEKGRPFVHQRGATKNVSTVGRKPGEIEERCDITENICLTHTLLLLQWVKESYFGVALLGHELLLCRRRAKGEARVAGKHGDCVRG